MTPIQLEPTGGDDTLLLQEALDAASLDIASLDNGSVELCGAFRVSAPLRAGYMDKRPPIIVGRNSATILYVGPPTSDYLIRYAGEGRLGAVRLANVWLECSKKCRGLCIHHQCYGASFQNIYIRNTVEVGLDFVGCWGSSARDIVLLNVAGIAVRFSGSNTATVDQLRVGGSEGNWPDPLDGSVINWLGKPVQTSEAQRACIVVNGGNQLRGNCWNIEACKYPSVPLVAGRCNDLRLDGVRVEGCTFTVPWIFNGRNNQVTNATAAI